MFAASGLKRAVIPSRRSMGSTYRAAAPAESMIEIAVLALRRLHTESGEICD
jgi:hypothetical protein